MTSIAIDFNAGRNGVSTIRVSGWVKAPPYPPADAGGTDFILGRLTRRLVEKGAANLVDLAQRRAEFER